MRLEGLLVAALRGERVPWPADDTETLQDAVLDAAADHGVVALLAGAAAVESWPSSVQASLHSVRRLEVATEAVRRLDLMRVIEAFAHAGVRGLLIKGAHIAYTHYRQPWLRPRFDTDLLIAPSDRVRADAVMRALGYAPPAQVSGQLIAHQLQYKRPNQYQLVDVVDLHWKVTNPHVFADTFSFGELEAEAVPLRALGKDAWGLSDAHALMLACVHRVAHHHNSDRLIWLYDIHMLLSAMDGGCRDRIAELARVKRVRSVCACGVSRAVHRFQTTVPRSWLDRLHATGDDVEPTAALLRDRGRQIDVLLSNLRTLPGARRKLRLIREHLFPPAAYIRQRYGLETPLLVPFAYVDRLVNGVGKWFREHS